MPEEHITIFDIRDKLPELENNLKDKIYGPLPEQVMSAFIRAVEWKIKKQQENSALFTFGDLLKGPTEERIRSMLARVSWEEGDSSQGNKPLLSLHIRNVPSPGTYLMAELMGQSFEMPVNRVQLSAYEGRIGGALSLLRAFTEASDNNGTVIFVDGTAELLANVRSWLEPVLRGQGGNDPIVARGLGKSIVIVSETMLSDETPGLDMSIYDGTIEMVPLSHEEERILMNELPETVNDRFALNPLYAS